MLAGGVDIATNIPPADWERVESNEGTSLKQEVSNRTLFLVLRATEGNVILCWILWLLVGQC